MSEGKESPVREENTSKSKGRAPWMTVGAAVLVLLLLYVIGSGAWVMLGGNKTPTPTPTRTPYPTFTPQTGATVVIAPKVASTPTPTPAPQVVVTLPPTPTPAAAAPSATPIHHTVKAGETLLDISRQYGVPVDLLMRANGIKDPNMIYVGQVLVIPTTGHTKVYVVRPGDTLSGIAAKLGVDPNELMELNHITNPDTIYAGQKLIVPEK